MRNLKYLLIVIVLGICGFMFNQRAEADINVVNVSEQASFKQIDAATAKDLMNSNTDYIILDVRTYMEYEEGHIPNAVVLPNEEIVESNDKIIEILPDKNQMIFVHCRSGRRSMEAASKLAKMGYINIYDFGGIIDWPYEIVK